MKPTFLSWKIVHLDLSNPLPSLSAQGCGQGYYVVFWWGTVPLGKCQIPLKVLPLTAKQLRQQATSAITSAVEQYLGLSFPASCPPSAIDLVRAVCELEKPLKTLEHMFEESDLSNHVLAAVAQTSVVVCTRDRPAQLQACLLALQSLSPVPAEILVIDNAPTDQKTWQLVQQFSNIQYVLEPEPGLSVARNTGIRKSTGKFIAFTDDDVRVHPQWLARLHRGFADSDTLAVTGLIIPAALETEAQVIFELSQGCLSGDYQPQSFDQHFFETTRHQGVPVWTIGAGANMAFRRSAFNQLGPFDTRLGAGASGCSEDSEFWYRILAAGKRCRYEPSAVVFHGHRQDLDSLNHQMYQYMRGHIAALAIQFVKTRHWGNLYRLFFALPKHYVGLGVGALIQGRLPKHRTYWAEITGCLAGLNYYLFGK